jgi:hypothetical protein
MSDAISTHFTGLKLVAQQRGEQLRSKSALVFEEAKELAETNGLVLRNHSEAHYQLKSENAGWLINVYPGNQRLLACQNRPKPPFLKMPCDWTVLDVVKVALGITE